MTIPAYKKYWDRWIKEWIKLAPLHSNSKLLELVVNYGQAITKWPVLNDKGGNNESSNDKLSWKFFPEPYWGDPESKSLHGVFINFNPGRGGHAQHIDTLAECNSISKVVSQPLACHRIWNKNPGHSYADAIKALYKECDYITTNWMIKNRQSFINRYNQKYYPKQQQDGEFVMFELCPWHTKSVTNKVYEYIEKNINLIDKYIIDFAIECSEKTSGNFKNIIISHGLELERIEKCKLVSLIPVKRELIKYNAVGTKLNKPWTIDVYEKVGTKVRILNFKNSSNGFPALTEELRIIIENYSK